MPPPPRFSFSGGSLPSVLSHLVGTGDAHDSENCPETSYPLLYTGRRGGRLFILASVSFMSMNIYKDSK